MISAEKKKDITTMTETKERTSTKGKERGKGREKTEAIDLT